MQPNLLVKKIQLLHTQSALNQSRCALIRIVPFIPYECLQGVFLVECMLHEVVGLFVFIVEQQFTEINCIHLESHSVK